MAEFTPWTSLAGGILIGLASAIVLFTQGRVAGVSGICGAVLRPTAGDWAWRVAFVAGLVGSGALLSPSFPAAFSTAGVPSSGWLIAAGLLVGFGTRLGNGCTSGHGVCGVARMSPRSLMATGTFMFTAGVTVYLMRHLLGVA
jgi:uncharacterized membrane protein YedE/YeeE